MKKTIFLLLAILLISFSNQSECTDKKGAKNKKDCNSLKISDDAYKCCYTHVKGEEGGVKIDVEGCSEIEKKDYDRIKDYISEMEKEAKDEGGKLEVKKFDCSSNYLLISIMSLILLLFL